ncbi:MAG: type II secretion system protein GspC [Acidobacteriota bacterium]
MPRLVLALLLVAQIAHADDLDPVYTCRAAGPGTKLRVTFKPETPLVDLATWVMGFSCKNVVFSSDVARHATRVTVMAPNELTPKQAVQLFVDAVEATGLVVVQKSDTIIIKLGPHMPASCPDVATAPAPPVMSPSPPSQADDDLAQAIETGIKKIDDTHVEIAKGVIDEILANPMAVAKGARIVPAIKDGKPNGFKLYAIRPSSVYARLNLLNGDTLVRVNGFELTSADKALEVYTKLREATSLQLDIERRGKPLSLFIRIR